MFNPGKLNIVVGSSIKGMPSFVGIHRTSSGDVEFCLPYGFDKFPKDDILQVNKLFFLLYRVLKEYSRNNKKYGIEIQHEMGDFENSVGEENPILFDQIAMIEAIVNYCDDIRILHIANQYKPSEEIDYSKIDRYLHKAIFLDDQPYIERMIVPGKSLNIDITDLVRMYCFVYIEIMRMISPEEINQEILNQSIVFQVKFLYSDSSLFSENHDKTIDDLQECFVNITKNIAWKNSDYWYFYNILEIFLFGSEEQDFGQNIHWGITDFKFIWEDMCAKWTFENIPDIVYADYSKKSNTIIGNKKIFLKSGFTNPFYLKINGNIRHIRPDVVVISGEDADEVYNNYIRKTKDYRGIHTFELKKNNSSAKEMFKELKIMLNRKKKGFSPHGNSMSYVTSCSSFEIDQVENQIKSKLAMLNKMKKSAKIIDYKYVPSIVYTSDKISKKATADIEKQNVYEICIASLFKNCIIKSQFCLPKYYEESPNNIGEFIDASEINPEITDMDVGIFEVDFIEVAKFYVMED